ncbi:MAG: NHL repeat-containing protein [Lachnospiraceae bacterium]|nr:NHL repeat-containing protein [Lachnospiraceae bacterium]
MKNMKSKAKLWKKIMLAVLSVCLLTPEVAVRADSTVPYDSYNYDYWEDIVFTPAPYIPDTSVSGTTIGVGSFLSPQDLCVSPGGNIYIADTGNHRIVEVDSKLSSAVREINGFVRDGVQEKFNQPNGVCVSQNGQIYIADSENHRIVVLEESDLSFVKIIENPEADVLPENFLFVPLKITVDYADRVYCIAKNMFQGIMVFEQDEFTGFFGTIEVNVSVWDKIWRKLSTKAQRSKQLLFIPTEFTGIDIDQKGFVYASNVDTWGKQAVRCLNPKGQDVIRKGENGNVGGDLVTSGTSDYSGVSRIVDVVYRDKGIYSLLDSRRGRIFTYDHEGNLLYIFGGLGTQAGTFTTPVAIEAVGDKVIVLDSYRKELLVFKETPYGRLINEAVGLRYDGDETLAVDMWKQVLMLDENNELANVGIGKAYLTAGDNERAMKYLKLGMSRQYYSVAYRRYRNEFLKEYLGYILTGLLAVIVAVVFVLKYRKKKKGVYEEEGGAFDV